MPIVDFAWQTFRRRSSETRFIHGKVKRSPSLLIFLMDAAGHATRLRGAAPSDAVLALAKVWR